MAGLVPAIHVLVSDWSRKYVDARDKPGHDGSNRQYGNPFATGSRSARWRIPLAPRCRAPLQPRLSPSRRDAPESLQDLPPGGRGECRVPSAPAASCALGRWSMHTSIHSGRTGNHPASPHAMVLTACFALSPVIGLSCHRHCRTKGLSAPGWADLPSDNLTPASRRQDHTTSPSATEFVVRVPFDRSRVVKPALHHVPRPTLPASTASRPASVTIAIRPSSETRQLRICR
jgi:hypothetical protein